MLSNYHACEMFRTFLEYDKFTLITTITNKSLGIFV
jgi:hypothetical protein